MIVNLSSYSDIGGREKNEDAILTQEDGKTVLALVADGLGGHGRGEMASQEAVATISKVLRSQAVSSALLQAAITAANDAIVHLQQESSGDMKSTITAVWLENGAARAAHVGDSRIYHFRDGNIIYQSMDHSMCQIDVLMGKITANEIRKSANRNLLIRALGSAESVKAEIAMLDIQHQDQILLCSDGFWELILETEMCACLTDSSTVQEWLEKMRRIVEKRSTLTSDNQSAIALWINSDNGGH